MPRQILADNGSPWGDPLRTKAFCKFEVWLMRLGVKLRHGRPRHPQTQGKEERFHRTLKVEVLQGREFQDNADVQCALGPWRHVYNHERPHEALGLEVPASRYRPSQREFPEALSLPEYLPEDIVRRVGRDGYIRIRGARVVLGLGLAKQDVAFRATPEDGIYDVWFMASMLGRINLNSINKEDWNTLKKDRL